MGVLNITPDSFYDGCEHTKLEVIKNKVSEIKDSDIIDIGAESSRPFSQTIDEKEELSRLSILDSIDFGDKLLSIDSSKYNVIRHCLDNGFKMINDISGGGKNFDNIKLACEFNVPIVVMHMQGNPENMQIKPHYTNIIDQIRSFFDNRINYANKIGMNENNMILDPGIGFGKTIKDNDEIILNLSRLKKEGYPLMIGVSRKSFLSNDNEPESRLPASLGVLAVSIMNGANIIRVHDVKETLRAVKIIEKIMGIN